MAEKGNKTIKKTEKQKRVADSSVVRGVQRLYDRAAPMLVCEALLFIVMGGLMLWKPVGLLTIMTLVFGGALVLFGLYRTIAGLIASREYGGGWQDVLFGLINVVVGVLFCAYPMGSIVGLSYVFIILFMFKAVRALLFAINMARARFGHWIFNLIMSVILLGMAVILMFFPVAGAVAMVIYLAVMLILYAFADIYMFFELRRLKKAVVD